MRKNNGFRQLQRPTFFPSVSKCLQILCGAPSGRGQVRWACMLILTSNLCVSCDVVMGGGNYRADMETPVTRKCNGSWRAEGNAPSKAVFIVMRIDWLICVLCAHCLTIACICFFTICYILLLLLFWTTDRLGFTGTLLLI